MDKEYQNYRKLQHHVDNLCRKIEDRAIDIDTVKLIAEKIRKIAERDFPDKTELFDMIYSSRFKRLSELYLSPNPEL
ncbi:MAG: hypothetical protein GY855_05610 [candidate division Zixibacteria bacterium]|nr:hypothetical protein [candidate division Zixibacteria bacterium]